MTVQSVAQENEHELVDLAESQGSDVGAAVF